MRQGPLPACSAGVAAMLGPRAAYPPAPDHDGDGDPRRLAGPRRLWWRAPRGGRDQHLDHPGDHLHDDHDDHHHDGAAHEHEAQAKAHHQGHDAAPRSRKALSEFVKNFRKKWTGRTECRGEYSVQDCKGYKAPKTSATPGTAAPVPQTSTPAQTTTAPTTIAKK